MTKKKENPKKRKAKQKPISQSNGAVMSKNVLQDLREMEDEARNEETSDGIFYEGPDHPWYG